METHRSCHANTEDDDRLLLALGGRGIGAGRPSFGRGSSGHVIVVTESGYTNNREIPSGKAILNWYIIQT